MKGLDTHTHTHRHCVCVCERERDMVLAKSLGIVMTVGSREREKNLCVWSE